MTTVGDYVTGPYQGVSQAPPQTRLAEQADILDDCYAAIPQGLSKRPPLEFECALASHPGQTDGIFQLVDATDQTYLLTLTREGGHTVPRLYPLAGIPLASLVPVPLVVSAAAQAYLDGGVPVPSRDLVVLTVEDSTFITNRNVTVAQTSDLSPPRPFEALVWVKAGAYARVYTVIVKPTTGATVTAQLKTAKGNDSSDANSTRTDLIAQTLTQGYVGVSGFGGIGNPFADTSGQLSTLAAQGFTVTQIGSVIYISHPTLDFTVQVTDDQAGTAMVALKNNVENFSDLPQRAKDGFVTKITQQTGTDADDFYVTFTEPGGFGTGSWKETVGPSSLLGFDHGTMPVQLKLVGGVWTADVAAWKDRDTGDVELAPDPDFVGRPLRDLTFYSGRLGAISSEEVILSAADTPFRLYPRTLATDRDDDPVSLISPTPGKSTFRFGVEFDSRLIVFGDKGQAAVQSDGTLTDKTAFIRNVSAFESPGLVRPQVVGSFIYFAAPRGNNYSVIYELKSARDSSGNYILVGEDMTSSVPKYIPSGLDRVTSSKVNYLALYGVSGSGYLFPHLFRYAEDQRVQNAWQRWVLPTGTLLGGIDSRNSTIYTLACHGGAGYLQTIDMSPDALDPGSSRVRTHWDFRTSEAQLASTYSALTDTTTLTLPWAIPVGSEGRVGIAVRSPGGPGGPALDEGMLPVLPEGYAGKVLSAAANVVTVEGDWTGVPFYVGMGYASRYRISTLYAQDRSGKLLRSGRVTLDRLLVDLADTGYLRAEVTPAGRRTYSTEFTGYTYDDPDSNYDVAPFADGKFTVPVHSNSERVTIDFVNDSHLGFKLLGFEWKAEFNPRATRL